jgi:hypothetical protein
MTPNEYAGGSAHQTHAEHKAMAVAGHPVPATSVLCAEEA